MSSKLCLAVLCIVAVTHAPAAKMPEHYNKDGAHDATFDHQAIVGSRKAEKDFSNLEPDEAKRRLEKIVMKMDTNKDSKIDRSELRAWVLHSFQALNEEDSLEDLSRADTDKDGLLSWPEYIDSEHNYSPKEVDDLLKGQDDDPQMKEFRELLQHDKMRFEMADQNKDKKLDKTEYAAFENPHNYDHMYESELAYRLQKADKDGDKKITFREFFESEGYTEEDIKDKEKQLSERTRFNEFDTNKNGKLERDEMKKWIMMNQDEMAEEEVEHLFSHTDENDDKILTLQEIIKEYSLWVGSEVAQYGHRLSDEL